MFLDSFYCRVQTVEKLRVQGVNSTGIVKKNSRGLPKELKEIKNLKIGETLFKRKGDLLGLLHKDKREIRLITTAYGNTIDEGGRPIAISEYNQWARGVDRGNQNSSYYHI